jgi:transcriptional regulator GlxA family with amidase domain
VAFPSGDRFPMQRRVRVSLVVFPEVDPSILYGVFDTLWAAGHLWNRMMGLPEREPVFDLKLVGARPGPLELFTGVSIVLQAGIDEVPETDIVFVPNVMLSDGASLRALDTTLLKWIREQFERGAHIYSACGGSLVLAEAGLLEGQEATTHWGYAPLFRKEFPHIRLHAERILVQTGKDQRIVCCGGASSWQDLVLFLVAQHAGAEEAVRLSKIFLYQWHRDGQLPYACLLKNAGTEDPVIREQQVWLAENYNKQNLVAALVQRCGLPERSFTRRFRAATGYTPLSYIQALRIEEAKQMLERSEATVEEVGREVGYQDPVSFRRLFKRLSGISPADYRRKLRMPRAYSGNFLASAAAERI